MATKAKPKKSASKKPAKSKVTQLRPSKRKAEEEGGMINKTLVKLFDNYAKLDEDKKQIGKAQRDIRAKAKEEHGIQSDVFNHEVRLRKMDSDRRVQFETGHTSLKESLGYQFTLELMNEEAGQEDDESSDPEEAARAAM